MSIYVPDEMYQQLRRREVPVSQVAQRAFAEELRGQANRAWIDRAGERPGRVSSWSTEDLMAAVDEDFES